MGADSVLISLNRFGEALSLKVGGEPAIDEANGDFRETSLEGAVTEMTRLDVLLFEQNNMAVPCLKTADGSFYRAPLAEGGIIQVELGPAAEVKSVQIGDTALTGPTGRVGEDPLEGLITGTGGCNVLRFTMQGRRCICITLPDGRLLITCT